MKKMNCLLILLAASLLLVSCGNESDARNEFLKCNKPWGERTEHEKIIGKWCGEKYQPGVGRRSTTQNMKFQTIICFYSDNTLKEFQRSESYMNSETEMDSGTNVQVNNGVLTYFSAKYGEESYNISVSESSLKIDGKISISMSDLYSKCN
jgi:hypothetical protein